MFRLIVNKGVSAIIVLLGSLFLVFSINYFLPSDAVDLMLAENGGNEELAESLRKELGLNLSFQEQFLHFITSLLHGDFGQSIVSREPVIDKILAHFPATIMLTLVSAVVAITVGVILGVLSAIHHNSFIDYAARIVGLFGISMPTFWSGVLLILFFSINLGWFPAMGSEGFSALVLPAITLGLAGAGFIVRIVRNSMLDVINEPFIITLRSKGITERAVMYRHALRNALIPAVTMIGVIIGDFLGGAVVIETVFARQGIGRIVSDAIMAKDLPVVQGVVFFTAIVYVSINLLVDLSYSFIDPRIRRRQLGGS